MKGLAILRNNRNWLKAYILSGVVLRYAPEKEIREAKIVAGFADHTK